MPPAAIAAGVTGLAGTGASAAGGKKASNAANRLAEQQQQLQQQQWNQALKQLNLGRSAFQPAENYWNALLHGGQAAVQATGPYASLIGQNAAGAQRAIQTALPRGGEQNLALAQSRIGASNDISRLYAGMQPTAASALGSLAGTAFGSGASFNPSANIGGALSNYANQQALAQQAGQGFGSILYRAGQKIPNQKTPNSISPSQIPLDQPQPGPGVLPPLVGLGPG